MIYLVCKYLATAEVDMARMRGIGADGAAIMSSYDSGVITRLKSVVPSSISVHCTAHQLNLASSHAGYSVSYI